MRATPTPTPALTSSKSHSARVAIALGVDRQARVAERPLGRLPERAAVAAHQRLLGRASPSGTAADGRQGMRLRQDRQQPVLADRVVVQIVEVVRALRQDHHLEIAAAQRLAQVDRPVVVQRDLGVGIGW